MLRYECYNCEKEFEEMENRMCPLCHSTNFIDKASTEIDLFKEIFGDDRAYFNRTCQLCCDQTLSKYFEKIRREKEILSLALDKACERVADSGQEYHEANTPEGWKEVYKKQAEEELTRKAFVKEMNRHRR